MVARSTAMQQQRICGLQGATAMRVSRWQWELQANSQAYFCNGQVAGAPGWSGSTAGQHCYKHVLADWLYLGCTCIGKQPSAWMHMIVPQGMFRTCAASQARSPRACCMTLCRSQTVKFNQSRLAHVPRCSSMLKLSITNFNILCTAVHADKIVIPFASCNH